MTFPEDHELPCDSAECYRLLMANIEDYAILLMNRDAVIIDWNLGIERVLGYSREEILGQSGDVIFTPEDRALGVPEIEMQRALEEGKSEDNRWHLKKDASLFFASGVMTTLRDDDGEVKGFLKIVRDRTESRQYVKRLEHDHEWAQAQVQESARGLVAAAEEVKRRERLLEAITDATPVVISVFDVLEQRVVYSNRTDGAILGYAPGELPKPSPERTRQLIHPDDLEQYYAAIESARQMSDDEAVKLECRFLHAQGTWRWLYNHYRVLARDAAGRVRELVGVTMDVTDRRESEERLRQLNEELEQRVALRTEEIQAANRELEAFSYSIAHDLRAPLRAINAFSRMATEEKNHNPERRDEYLTKIYEQSMRMEGMLQGLLAFSKATRQPVLRHNVGMREVVDEALDMLQVDLVGRDINIEVGDLPACAGDKTLLKQVWVNLIANAIKYTRKVEHAEIKIGSQTGAGDPVYYVSDNGAGFDMKLVHKLFGVFQRLHAEAEFEGAGVGLAIVHRILARHGGSIWAESAPGEGTTMFFTLPCSSEPSQ